MPSAGRSMEPKAMRSPSSAEASARILQDTGLFWRDTSWAQQVTASLLIQRPAPSIPVLFHPLLIYKATGLAAGSMPWRLNHPSNAIPTGRGTQRMDPTLPHPCGKGHDIKPQCLRGWGWPSSPQGSPCSWCAFIFRICLSRDLCPLPPPPAPLEWLHSELPGP